MFRQQRSCSKEKEATIKHRQWEEEKKKKEEAQLALEKERGEIIIKKRDQKRKDLDYRLQQSRKS
jgi:hypothetical protein